MTFDYLRLRTDASYRAELIDWVGEDDELREAGRLLAKTNLLALCYILGYGKIDPEVHREALEFFIPRDLSKPVSRQGEGHKTRGTLLYPRGTYKTTLDEADIVQECLCFPADGITFVVSANAKLAEALVDNVRDHFVKGANARPTLLQALFPELCLSPINARDTGRFSLPGRQQSPPIKEHLVMAFSVESGVSGWHCWRFKGDDIANNRNMKSETSQLDISRNYGINRKMLNPGGIEDKLGTRYGPLDPYGIELAKSRPGSYRYVVKPALRLKSGARLDANGFPPKEEVDLLFEPTGLTYDFLRDEYDADYSAFMTQYMNDAFGDNEVVFDQKVMLESLKDEDQLPLDGQTTIRFRLPNKGLGWGFAVGVAGTEQGGRMYIIDALHGAYKPSVLSNKVVEFAKKHDVHSIEIEDAPGARKLGPAIQNYALTLGYALNIRWAPHEPDAGERDQRIKTVEPLLLAKRLIIAEDLQLIRKVFEQFTSYGMMAEDGFPDVISRLCENLPRSISRAEEEPEDGLAYEAALHRDHWNQLYGAGAYARREPDPTELLAVDTYEEPAPNPWGLEDIIPGLNA